MNNTQPSSNGPSIADAAVLDSGTVSPTQSDLLSVENEPEQTEESVADLLQIAIDALSISPPRLVSAVFGKPHTWIPPYKRYSEFRILNLWRLRRTLKYLLNVTVPSIPRTPPPFGPPLLNGLFYQPSVILQRPDHNGNYTTHPDEAWFFINGIMTNDSLAHVNAAYLAYLFHRPITLIQNSTDSFLIDMLQCMLGKEWQHTTEPARKAVPVIYDALKSPHKRKVVIIAHSQGTIIAANVLRALYALTQPPEALEAFAEPEFVFPDQTPIKPEEFQPLSVDELAKLEVYCFATCANELTYFDSAAPAGPIPWIEHFGNEYDIVARLGMQAPTLNKSDIEIQGPRYMHHGAWGHFLNAHYLFAIAKEQKKGRKRRGADSCDPFQLINKEDPHDEYGPRLFQYINGGVPLG